MANVIVRNAILADEDGIVNLLEGFYPGVPNHWRKMFVPRNWKVENEFPGFVIEDGNKIVGFVGTIFYENKTGKDTIKICNLTSLYVDPAYRQFSMLLFSKINKISDVAVTNLTPAPHTVEFFMRMGFKVLEDTQTRVLPLPPLKRDSIEINIDINQCDLPDSYHSIYQMHRQHGRHIVFKKGNSLCYCIAVITRYKKIPLAKLYYISDIAFFRENIKEIRWGLCFKLRVFYFVIEGDIFEDKKYLGIRALKLSAPRLYKSNYPKEYLTLLGSELFVLGI